MIINPEKFQAIILDKQTFSNETIRVDKKTVGTVPSVRHLGLQLDDKLWLQTKCINPLSTNPTK